jgi:outer membrane biosynthesis protein TonB
MCFLFLAAQSAVAAENPFEAVLECSPVPKIRSFGEEYPTTERMPDGLVVVDVVISRAGKVLAARVTESSDPKLAKRALSSAHKLVFDSPKATCRTRIPMQFRAQ